MRTGAVWSAGLPAQRDGGRHATRSYTEDQAEFTRRDGSIATSLTVVVSAEDDAEIRRVTLTNLGSRAREIELTSYARSCSPRRPPTSRIRRSRTSSSRPSSSPEVGALLATRRPRSRESGRSGRRTWRPSRREAGPIAVRDRSRPLPRPRPDGADRRSSVVDGRPLSNTVGVGARPDLQPPLPDAARTGATAHAIFSTVVAESREQVLDLADKYREPAAFERAATLAWTQAQVQLHHLGIGADEAHLFQRLANRILYSDPSLRPAPTLLARSDRGASGLWPYGILKYVAQVDVERYRSLIDRLGLRR